MSTENTIKCIDCERDIPVGDPDGICPEGWEWVFRATPHWAWDAGGSGPYLQCPECVEWERTYYPEPSSTARARLGTEVIPKPE